MARACSEVDSVYLSLLTLRMATELALFISVPRCWPAASGLPTHTRA